MPAQVEQEIEQERVLCLQMMACKVNPIEKCNSVAKSRISEGGGMHLMLCR